MVAPGIYAYLGAPKQGKTTLARKEWEACCRATPLPGLCIDSGRADNLRDLPHADSLAHAIELLYKRGGFVAWTPETQADFDACVRALRAAGRVALLVDEFSFWKFTGDVQKLLRTWRHCMVPVFVTAHHIGSDLAQGFLAANPNMRVFKLSAPRSVEFFMRYHGLDPDEIRNLRVGEYREVAL